jgi:hypothetical protein
MDLWLRNDTSENRTGLRTQICLMLKGAPDFNAQANDNQIFRSPACAVKPTQGNRWIIVVWDRCGYAWGNPLVPCMHGDPVLPDCAPGQMVRVRGRLCFYDGSDIEAEINRAHELFSARPTNG